MADLFPHEDPARRCLKLADWPARDQAAWEAILSPGDILDGTMGAGLKWRPETREKYRKGYGRWLNFLLNNSLLDPNEAPEERVTPERIRVYIEELQAQNVASWTRYGRLAELQSVIAAFAPSRDFGWLNRATRYHERNAVDRRQKLHRLQPAHVILQWALTRMDAIRLAPPKRDWAGSYRDALMIGLLAVCPVRLGNLTMIELDRHLIRINKAFHLRFAGGETKTGHALDLPVLDALTEPINHYLDAVRPVLLAGENHPRFWITRYGQPMNNKMMHLAITRTTERAFGRPINPHLFRDCAATFVALEDPEHIGIAGPLLGHVDLRTTQKHYIQANQMIAGRRLNHSVARLRKKLCATKSTRKA